MLALITGALVIACFTLTAGYISYWQGYDRAWLEAFTILEEEIKNGLQD